jgi:leucyl aminopeptidase
VGDVTSTQQNIVAVVQGTEPGAGTLVVGAHYDSIVQPDFNDGASFAPGANDNGSGVAAIIELARILSQRQYRASVMLVAFSAEEVNRRGSRAFVDYLQSQNIDIIGMVNIDTIGNTQDFQGNTNDTELRVFSDGPNATSTSRHFARIAEFISYTHNLPLKLIVEDSPDREGRYGDHFSFSEKGYSAIRFIQAFEEKTNGDPTDTIEFVEPEYLRKAVQSILVVITAKADGPRPPRNISLRDKGNGVSSWSGSLCLMRRVILSLYGGAIPYAMTNKFRLRAIRLIGMALGVMRVLPFQRLVPMALLDRYRVNIGCSRW